MSDKVLDTAMIEKMLALLPADQQARLFMLAMDESATDAQMEAAAREALMSVDWETQRDDIRELIGHIMPLDTLVPNVYVNWRPVIRDAVTYVGSRLPVDRLIPKLLRQMMLPAEMPLEQRLFILLSKMPSLQKIGQIVARNPNLDPAFRAQLTRLENGIEDVTPTEIRDTLNEELGKYLTIYRVEVEEVALAEASVSAVVRFTWMNPVSRKRERGVFKVLKPYVRQNFPEEMAILQTLANFFDENRDNYDLPNVGFREVMDDIRRLLTREIELVAEQASLQSAKERYKKVSGVRIPTLIRELSTQNVTAMSEESGVKVTDAYPHNPRHRAKLAQKIVEALIAVPLFAPEEHSFFHADPHAGNLFADESTGDLIILDWALREYLNREQRRQTVLLALAVALRDEERVVEAISILSEDDFAQNEYLADLVRGHVRKFFTDLSPLQVPGFVEVSTLLDGLAFGGIQFPAELLMFRKVMFTLEGVLHDLDPDLNMDVVLGRYALQLMTAEVPKRLLRPFTDTTQTFRTHLSNYDLTLLVFSLPLLGNRIWLQTAENVTYKGLDELQRTVAKLLPSSTETDKENSL